MSPFPSAEAARDAYLENYEDGWQGIGAVTKISLGELATRLKSPTGFAKPLRYREPAEPKVLAATGVSTMSPSYSDAGSDYAAASAHARPDAIRQTIRDLLSVPINEGGVTMRKALGIYKVQPRTIRVKNQNDIGVIAHETFHHFEQISPTVRGLVEKHAKELATITPYAPARNPGGCSSLRAWPNSAASISRQLSAVARRFTSARSLA